MKSDKTGKIIDECRKKINQISNHDLKCEYDYKIDNFAKERSELKQREAVFDIFEFILSFPLLNGKDNETKISLESILKGERNIAIAHIYGTDNIYLAISGKINIRYNELEKVLNEKFSLFNFCLCGNNENDFDTYTYKIKWLTNNNELYDVGEIENHIDTLENEINNIEDRIADFYKQKKKNIDEIYYADKDKEDFHKKIDNCKANIEDCKSQIESLKNMNGIMKFNLHRIKNLLQNKIGISRKCTERKIFEKINAQGLFLKQNKIIMFTFLPPCYSCRALIKELNEKYHNIINVHEYLEVILKDENKLNVELFNDINYLYNDICKIINEQ